MNQPAQSVDPLAQLKDIHTPDPISWWPLAPGWWILAVLIIITLFFLTRWIIKRVQDKPAIKQAKQAIEQLKTKPPEKQFLVEALHLLRRSALSKFAKEQVASLPLHTLAQQLSKAQQLTLNSPSIELMHTAQYAPEVSITNDQWHLFLQDLQQLIIALDKTQSLPKEAEHV
ncbi:DUF4381 domain-containing protein [Pleionea sediminis]|uniref:DUF4381 domain-containing protein n=1 Tax=Pleionea sediminis TaxID=2569479 RepID=UPI0011869293|nr:DUF4381 domain-containing protein [Pleionea sediminis]